MKLSKRIIKYFREFGYRQVPVWYDSSISVLDDFETIGTKLKFVKLIPNPFPFYDWIMGFHERWSNRAALQGPILERVNSILDAGVGTGYFLSKVIQMTNSNQKITAVDLSRQMLNNAKAYAIKHNLFSERITFERGDCKALPHKDESFDLYISSYLFDLLSDDEIMRAINEMERVLMLDGHAILITMTTEISDIWWPRRIYSRIMNELYCLGYYRGRWNFIWKFLFADYAPHCRPIGLGSYLRRFPSLAIEYTKITHVSLFPVRIYYVRKSHK
jgi:ubiquinone/menaquinone biosynthesis C-methylase UbiE